MHIFVFHSSIKDYRVLGSDLGVEYTILSGYEHVHSVFLLSHLSLSLPLIARNYHYMLELSCLNNKPKQLMNIFTLQFVYKMLMSKIVTSNIAFLQNVFIQLLITVLLTCSLLLLYPLSVLNHYFPDSIFTARSVVIIF